MKTYKYAILIILLTSVSVAQWQPDIRLTNYSDNSYTSYNYAKSIGMNGSFVHVVWFDRRDGNYEIYYKRSSNKGISWDIDLRLTNDTASSEFPSISVFNDNIYVVWRDKRTGNWEVYYKYSSNSGANWTTDLRLTNSLPILHGPSIFAVNSNLHVIWFDFRDGNYEIYYKKSVNGGIDWGADVRLTNNSFNSWYPSISVSGLIVHIVWFDDRDGNWEIYYKRSTNEGINWSSDIRLTANAADSRDPSISVLGSIVNVVWDDYRNGSSEIYYKKSSDSGLNWDQDTRITNNPANSFEPSTTLSDSTVHIVWNDDRDGNMEVYYKKSVNSGINWEVDTRLTNGIGNSYYASLIHSDSVLHIVWTDERDNNPEIYYKRNPTGNVVGFTNFNAEIPNEFQLYQNYPNPFNPVTKIRFDIPVGTRHGAFVQIKVFDILGREVATLVNEQLKPGTYEVDFDGSNFTSGVYFYSLIATGFTETKRMVLIK